VVIGLERALKVFYRTQDTLIHSQELIHQGADQLTGLSEVPIRRTVARRDAWLSSHGPDHLRVFFPARGTDITLDSNLQSGDGVLTEMHTHWDVDRSRWPTFLGGGALPSGLQWIGRALSASAARKAVNRSKLLTADERAAAREEIAKGNADIRLETGVRITTENQERTSRNARSQRMTVSIERTLSKDTGTRFSLRMKRLFNPVTWVRHALSISVSAEAEALPATDAPRTFTAGPEGSGAPAGKTGPAANSDGAPSLYM